THIFISQGVAAYRLPWGVRAQDTLDLEAVLDGIVPAVAEFTGERRGLIGSVHHGRTVAGSDRLVGALARVLPATYDLDDPAVLRSGVRRLLAGQAALAADVGRGAAPTDPAGERRGATPGAALPMPVVVQVIRAGGTSGRSEHPGVLRRIAFEARTKFAVLLTLVADPDGDVLEVTLSTDHYDHDDLDRLVSLLAPLAPAASPAPLAPVTPIRTGAPA
ncbi:MAG: hypothetical protein JWP82_65, partial [Humibacillus sp.]|nr:hypothetical protein [Humibacillus sp.]